MFNVSVQDEAALEHLLRVLGLPVDEYGGQGIKSLAELAAEFESGEANLVIDANGPARQIRVARIRVIHGDQVLVETMQVFKDGRGRRERDFPFVSEKLGPVELPRDGADRALIEELGIHTRGGFREVGNPGEPKKESRPSESYPGLDTRYLFYDFCLELDSDDSRFEPDGYVEKGDVKDTYFEWRLATNYPTWG